MFRPFARLVIASALVFSIGLHWVVLQSAGWAEMMVRYSVEQGSLITGLSHTFDARHPCALCGAVRQGMQTEQSQTQDDAGLSSGAKKLVLTLPEAAADSLPQTQATERPRRPAESHLAMTRPTRPPVPPPRRGPARLLVG